MDFRYQYVGVLPFWFEQGTTFTELNFSVGEAADKVVTAIREQATTAVYASRLKLGDEFVCVAKNEELIGVCWLSKSKYHDIDTNVDVYLEQNERWLYGAWVRRDWRGKGIYRKLLETAIGPLNQIGVNQFLLAVDASNRNSYATHNRLGARWIGRCYGVKVFGCGSYRLTLNR